MTLRKPYVYLLIDRVTSKQYIGAQWGKDANPDNLGTTYFSSSSVVSLLFRNEPDRFMAYVLFEGSVDEVRAKELTLLNQLNCAMSEDYYNLRNSTLTLEESFKGGKASGARNVANGHAFQFGHLYGPLNAHHGGKANARSGHISRLGVSQGKKNAENGHLSSLRTIEHQKKAASAAGKITGPLVVAMRFTCSECGVTMSPPSLGNHQKSSGHKGVIK